MDPINWVQGLTWVEVALSLGTIPRYAPRAFPIIIWGKCNCFQG